MLVVFSGVSGVGKTAICRRLAAEYAWNFITTYTTRPSRPGELEKVTISAPDFAVKECSGEFFCKDSFYGSQYGLSAADVTRAVSNRESFWMIDRPIWRLGTFRETPHMSVILLPASRAQLVTQLARAGRDARREEVLLDYDTNYSRFHNNPPTTKNSLTIINSPGHIDEAVELVAAWCSSQG